MQRYKNFETFAVKGKNEIYFIAIKNFYALNSL